MLFMKEWKSDTERYRLMRAELFTAVVGDVMDQLGFRRQFLPPRIAPLRDDMVVAGRAMPVLEADVFEGDPKGNNRLLQKPFGLMLEALDDLKAGEVYICTGASPSYALWGELMSARAIRCGAVGAIVDGYSRDTRGILSQNFPCFSYGPYSQDQAPRGKVIDFRISIEIGGVLIEPGSLLFGDVEGVCVIPKECEDEVLAKSIEKARGEKLVRRAIDDGMTAVEAFARFGIM